MKSKLLLLLLALPITSPALTLINDSFDDGGRTNGTDASDVAWYYEKSSGFTVASGGNLTNALSFNSNGNTASFVAALPQNLTLTNTGEYLSVSFDYSRSASANFHSGMRVGFFNIDTVPSADNFVAGFDAALGYTAELPSEGQTNRTLRLREDTDVSSSRLRDTQNNTTGQLSSQSSAAIYVPAAGSADLPLTVTFTLTRVDTGLELKVSSDLNSTTYSVIDTASPYYTFNTIGFGQAAANQINYWDNIVVTTNVPEPSSAGLVGIAVGAWMLFCRRRRS